MPRVTVICSTYNWSSVLPYSIGSVIRQSDSDWELLVIGDGCTDDSEAVVERVRREHGLSDDKLRWINLEQGCGNQYGPNNEGLRQARGEIIAYIGHDDLWFPHHLQCLVAAIDGGADVAYSSIRWVAPDEQGSPVLYYADGISAPTGTMHRISVAQQIGGWRDYRTIVQVPQDDFWGRLREINARFQFVPRLSAIKFGAAARKNSYQERSCREQQLWTQRLQIEPDLEQTELVRMLAHSIHNYVARDNDYRSTFDARIRYHLQRLRSGQLRRPKQTLAPGDQVREYRRAKGLKD